MKKTILASILTGGLLATLASAQDQERRGDPEPQGYTITDLGPPGNPFSSPTFINNHGLIGGSDTAPDGASHAVLWYKGQFLLDIKDLTDARQPSVLGPNSAAGPVNESGVVVLGSETTVPDPNQENFCDDVMPTGLQCVVFSWQFGLLTQLPTLGGTNSNWGAMNNRGEIAGFAENDTKDRDCLAKPPNGGGPQALDYEAVIWGPELSQIRELKPLGGDTVGLAFGINDAGEVVGVSGECGNTVLPPFTAGPHAVLWDKDGVAHDLGSFGGTSNPAILAVGNAAVAINNRGQVVGTSAMPGNLVNQPFLWTAETGIQHLKLLSGDVVGAGLDINNRGEVVGASISSGGPATGMPKAVVWRNDGDREVIDLNTFLTPDSPFGALLTAYGINDAGEIVGFGMTTTGDMHAFLATPSDNAGNLESAGRSVRPMFIPENARKMLYGHRRR